MSILAKEYDEVAARRVYAEERVEERVESMALEMLHNGIEVHMVALITKLPIETIYDLQHRV